VPLRVHPSRRGRHLDVSLGHDRSDERKKKRIALVVCGNTLSDYQSALPILEMKKAEDWLRKGLKLEALRGH